MTDEEKQMRDLAMSVVFRNSPIMRTIAKFALDTVTDFNSSEKTYSESTTPSKTAPKLPDIPLVHKKEYYGDNVAEVTTVIRNRCGMHANPCSLFVSTANKFNSNIKFTAKGKKVDAKSILMLMSLGLVRGTEITISAEGSDASEAVKTLVELIDNKFNEE